MIKEAHFSIYENEADEAGVPFASFGSSAYNIHITCSYKNRQAGYTTSRCISRPENKGNFLKSLTELGYDIEHMAIELFDRYGRLNRRFIKHVIQKGSGVFGAELDKGALILIQAILIPSKEYRRKGLGRGMMLALLERAKQRATEVPNRTLYVMVKPEPFSTGALEEGWQRALDSAIAFYRSIGFRRVGASNYFCFALDPRHMAHTLPASADYDPPPRLEYDFMAPPLSENQQAVQKIMEKFIYTVGLTTEVQAPDDAQLVENFQTLKDTDDAWKQIDEEDRNILHHTAYAHLILSTKWILENIDPKQELSLARNWQGLTPLEALQIQLDDSRKFSEPPSQEMSFDSSDRFRGYSPEAIECLSLLTYGMTCNSLSDIQTLRLKYGCTCGECIGGFISPRMERALRHEIKVLCQKKKIADPTCVPKFGIFTNNAEGFKDFCLHLDALMVSKETPNVRNLLLGLHTADEDTVKAAWEIVIKGAMNHDELIGVKWPKFTDVAGLKECRNDHEFGMVRLACGL